ncbi:MAG: PepSY domain-containing protein [Bacteroides sp.]|nr:PepSY domain-containing protein [Bacteroides sp.]
MRLLRWKKQHKWFGLLFGGFLLIFCLSGIILNHRTAVSGIDVSRKWLPSSYRFTNWNLGLVRGTLKAQIGEKTVVLLYGDAGIWLTDSLASSFTAFNDGLPQGAAFKSIRNIVQTKKGSLFCAGTFGLYQYDFAKQQWEATELKMKEERLADLTIRNDTLIVVGRSYLYISSAPYHQFELVQLQAPQGYDGKVSLFRTVWLLHSGELFGAFGKLIMDGIALLLIILWLTGLLYWFLPKQLRRAKRRGQKSLISRRLFKSSFSWHDKSGRWTIVLTLLVATTGWCLRPPLLIPLFLTKTSPIPGTILDVSNAWEDRLRMLRFDKQHREWILSTSEGFFTLSSLESIPIQQIDAPPVSVMGINVLSDDTHGNWLVGSFSGLYIWNRRNNQIRDFYTQETPRPGNGSPFGQYAIAGYSTDFIKEAYVFDYQTGSNFVPMPDFFATLPMSLWKLCVEVHTGRIYTFLGPVTVLFIFLAGLCTIWLLITGYKIRRNKKYLIMNGNLRKIRG